MNRYDHHKKFRNPYRPYLERLADVGAWGGVGVVPRGSLPGRVGFLCGFPGVAGVAGCLAVDCEVCAAAADWFDVVYFGGLGGASWSAYLACVVVAV